ncbi:hypothetical protein DYB26_013900 [Aphanomyces astaci]|uniref:HTH CENPB-type domain-containing protein n=2 Tax=Aphanomyces astaci TaxID=112090 RepID=A0A397FE24_APHAT|nr:hypothetical protein DYB31_006559 [Aphanomyces astaci]RHZ39121.1 hypothetical protein DYB26_013900 [Aphanomyces astaci]
MDVAVRAVLNKTHSLLTAAEAHGIPQRTLRTHVAKAITGDNRPTAMGRPPVLPKEFEDDLATWIVAMEHEGVPVGCRQIVDKATEILQVVHDAARDTKLTSGWYKRFLERNQDLKIAKARTLSKPRNGVDNDTVVEFFHELAHSMSLVDMDPSRVFNMDETSLRRQGRWLSSARPRMFTFKKRQPQPSSRLSLPTGQRFHRCSLFVLPGDTVSTLECDSLYIHGAAITTSEKGWTNSFICRKWTSMLNSSIPISTPRPILLILDGCSSHYSEHIYDAATSFDILLQFLPANSTHMFQTLDVTVFRSFKHAIRQEIRDLFWTDVGSTIKKLHAIKIACNVWPNDTSSSAISAGFVCTGLCPPSLDNMMYRLSLYKPAEVAKKDVEESWLQRTTIVRNHVLLLPPEKKRKRAPRKRLTVSGKLITSDYHGLLQAQALEKPKRKKKATQDDVAVQVLNSDDIVEVCVI